MELLAPAGERDAALAAFHYGADAIYLGLQQFSARAEAANFTPDELSEIVAFAHAASPRRSVFLAVNTLILDCELPDIVRTLGVAADLGVDALIVQDLGVARLARRCAPGVELHASTQMAIHNVEGARALRRLGFSRVTLARELTLDEIREVVRGSGLDVEVFIHGALCYCYSGLCLYSSLLRGRSGNRGRCTYPCRDRFTAGTVGEAGFPFSMKDLALPDAVQALRDAGVLSFKIEGRKKSPLYVAATTHYYRRLLDGRLSRQARAEAEADIQTIFARPWTKLHINSARSQAVVDAEVVGHRGTPIGKVEAVVRRGRQDWLRFTTRRRLEKHDGLQIDGGENGRPFGFAVDELRPFGGGAPARPVFEIDANTRVEVPLPDEHPSIEAGVTVYCSSSQAVRQHYSFERPRPGVYRVRTPVNVVVTVLPDTVSAEATVVAPGAPAGAVARADEHGTFDVGRRADAGEPAVREAFGKMGDTPFQVCDLSVANPDRRFVPVSVLNRLRRAVAAALTAEVERARATRDVALCDAELNPADTKRGETRRHETPAAAVRWSLKTDRLEHVEAFGDEDWQGMEELIVDVSAAQPARMAEAWSLFAERLGTDRVRMALPILMRAWERPAMAEVVDRLWQAGCRRWEASNLWAWTVLEGVAGAEMPDLRVDWPMYVLNRQAARGLLDLGVHAFVCSPEDGLPNMRGLFDACGERAQVIVYQDSPLFISENCGRSGLARECRADGACRRADLPLVSGSGESVRLIQRGCRTIVIGAQPHCLSRRLGDLRSAGARRFRADLVWRHYQPEEAVSLWRDLRAGRLVPGVEGNFQPGLS